MSADRKHYQSEEVLTGTITKTTFLLHVIKTPPWVIPYYFIRSSWHLQLYIDK